MDSDVEAISSMSTLSLVGFIKKGVCTKMYIPLSTGSHIKSVFLSLLLSEGIQKKRISKMQKMQR